MATEWKVAPEVFFLGWRAPLLTSAVEWLSVPDRLPTEVGGCAQPDGPILVVPGQRAARRLLEALAVELSGPNFVPPRIVTPGRLLDELLEPASQVATELERLLAWRIALNESPRPELLDLFGPGAQDSVGDLAVEVRQVADELGMEGLSLGSARARLGGSEQEVESRRWELLERLETRYSVVLLRSALSCPHSVRRQTLFETERRGDGAGAATGPEIVLVGVAELPGLVRRALETCSRRVRALVQAPPEERAGFDELGCPRSDWWSDRYLDYGRCARLTAEDPFEMVTLAVERLPTDPSLATVGVGDQALLQPLADELELRHVPFHSPVGRSFVSSVPFAAIRALLRYLSSRSLEDLGTALRSPLVEGWLARECVVSDTGDEGAQVGHSWRRRATRALLSGDLLTALDIFATETLAGRVPSDREALLETWLVAVDAALASLLGEEPADTSRGIRPQCLSTWAGKIGDALVGLYGSEDLDLSLAEDAELASALERLGGVLERLAGLPADLDLSVSGSEALRLLTEVAGATPLPSTTSEAQGVEILGWLELPLDDADILHVLGLNEGTVPQTVGGDVLLPNPARQRLGLPDDAQRFARDAFHLRGLLESRTKVTLLSALRGPQEEPLLPSRLLLHKPPTELAGALDDYYRITPASSSDPWAEQATESASAPEPRTRPSQGPLELPSGLPVTAFRDYLTCPYRFYLRRVAKLTAVRDRPRELEPGAFGNLAHEVLRRFAETDAALATDEEFVEQTLHDLQHDVVVNALAPDLRSAVQVQLAQLRHRFSRFARWQAEQVQEGWQIDQKLCEVESSSALHVDGAPFEIRGRIDRVDRHPVLGLRLLDYKTGDSPKTPAQAHQRSGQWIDLQLPLYRFLAEDQGWDKADVGFVAISKKSKADLLLLSKWSEPDFASALETARDVVRKIRDGIFWPPSDPPQYEDGLELVAGDRLATHLRHGRPPGFFGHAPEPSE